MDTTWEPTIYEYGDTAKLTATFQAPDQNGVLQYTNPDSLTLYIRPETASSPTVYVEGQPGSIITSDGVGKFHALDPVPPCPSGRLLLKVYYQFVGTGAAAGAGERYYLVKASQANPGH